MTKISKLIGLGLVFAVAAAQAYVRSPAPHHGYYICYAKKTNDCFIQKKPCVNETKSIEQYSWYSSYHHARAGLAKCLKEYKKTPVKQNL